MDKEPGEDRQGNGGSNLVNLNTRRTDNERRSFFSKGMDNKFETNRVDKPGNKFFDNTGNNSGNNNQKDFGSFFKAKNQTSNPFGGPRIKPDTNNDKEESNKHMERYKVNLDQRKEETIKEEKEPNISQSDPFSNRNNTTKQDFPEKSNSSFFKQKEERTGNDDRQEKKTNFLNNNTTGESTNFFKQKQDNKQNQETDTKRQNTKPDNKFFNNAGNNNKQEDQTNINKFFNNKQDNNKEPQKDNKNTVSEDKLDENMTIGEITYKWSKTMAKDLKVFKQVGIMVNEIELNIQENEQHVS